MDKTKVMKRAVSLFLASAMLIGVAPISTFAEVQKANWTIDEKKEAEMSFWKLSDINEVDVVANAEGFKTPSVNYIGTYINADGRTVIRVSYRMFQNLASAVWSKALFKFDKDLYDLIDFGNPGTGMYKGAIDGGWHDSKTYKDIAAFTNVVSSLSGAVNVKEQNLDNNGNKVGGSSRIEIPIDLVLKDGKTVGDIKGQPHIQMRITNDDYSKVFCVAGTEKSNTQNIITTPYNSYTFMTYIPSANNNADVGTVSDYNMDYQFYSANSYAKYNEEGGYLDVFHKQSKLASNEKIGGESYAFRQVFNEKFADVLKPQDGSGTVAEVFTANQQGEMWGTTKPIKITMSDINTSDNSDLNPGFKGIQVASSYKNGTITNTEKFAGLNTVVTTANPKESFLNGSTTEFNSGLPTITRYYIDKDEVAKKGLTNDDLAAFDFYSTFILDSTKKFIEYTATNNTGSDIVLGPNSNIGLTYADNKTSTPNSELDKYSLTFGDDAYKIELRSNFKHVGGGSLQPGRGREYEHNLIPGMTIKTGEKITFRTMKYDTPPTKVTLTLPSKDGSKTIDLLPGAGGAEKTTPRRLNYITTYAGGSATQSGVNPDIDELFTDSQNITGRTRYVGAKIKLFYPDNTDYEFTIADQKTRTKMNVNGAEENGYTFTTEGKDGFTMPTGLVKDSVIGITNTDVKKASTPSEKVFEKVQAKVTFDLNGGKLPTTTNSFGGYDEKALPGTEFAYKLTRAKETDPVVRIAPMNEKAAGEEGYTPNGFNVAKYIDHNGDELKDDALALRKIAENPTKDGQQFYGWTTKKVNTVDEYNALEELKTADQAKDTTKAYKFTENSPILTGTTVYAFYGAAKSVEANPVQKYDEATDKQYIEGILPEGKTLPAGATVELVQKNADGTYTKVNVPVEVKDGRITIDVKNKNIKDGEEYYIAVTEDGKPTTYSTGSVKVDKAGPSFGDGDNDITIKQDAYGYQVKISAKAKDDAGILRIYAEDDKSEANSYHDAKAEKTEAGISGVIQKQGGVKKTFTVTAIDKFGNKTTAKKEVQPVVEDLELRVVNPRSGKDFVIVTTTPGATVTVEVVGQDVKIRHTQGNSSDKVKLEKNGSPFKLSRRQKVKVTAEKDGQKVHVTTRVK